MRRSTKTEFTFALIVAALISILYRYWLICPILRCLSLGPWRLVAVFVAVTIGSASSLLGLPVRALLVAVVAGLLLGGTWAFFLVATDVRVTFRSAGISHLESFWREVIVFTIVIVLSSLFVSRFRRPRPH